MSVTSWPKGTIIKARRMGSRYRYYRVEDHADGHYTRRRGPAGYAYLWHTWVRPEDLSNVKVVRLGTGRSET